MRLGILSDTHDELARTKHAVQALLDAGAEALIHCGDLASPPIVELWRESGTFPPDSEAVKHRAYDY